VGPRAGLDDMEKSNLVNYYAYLSIYLSICLSIYLSVYLSICLSIYGFTALVDFGRFFSFLLHTQSGGVLGRGISPSQGRLLHT
jgi:hypothetical protein